MKKILFVALLILLFLLQNAIADENRISEGKKETIKELIQITGTLKVGKQFSAVMIDLMSQVMLYSNPELPEKAMDILEEEADIVVKEQMISKNGFLDKIYPIYSKHFTHDELKELIEFYKRPLGKKIIEKMPVVSYEGTVAGQSWGIELVPLLKKRLSERFKKEGIHVDLELNNNPGTENGEWTKQNANGVEI